MRGALHTNSFGLSIDLPFENTSEIQQQLKTNRLHYKYFFTRKLFLVKEASAFVCFPGGFGTFDEAFETLTLVQTGKTSLIPIVFIEPSGYQFWETFRTFVNDALIKHAFISKEDLSLYTFCTSAKEAMDHIDNFYSNYHSMRFVKDKLVLRLKKNLNEDHLNQINQRFKYLLTKDKFILSPPLAEEENEPELSHLYRLIFYFNRKNFGGLRELINDINASI